MLGYVWKVVCIICSQVCTITLCIEKDTLQCVYKRGKIVLFNVGRIFQGVFTREARLSAVDSQTKHEVPKFLPTVFSIYRQGVRPEPH